MADVKANELTAETSTTLNGAEQFVMFDTAEGKRCTINDLLKYIRAKQGSMERKNVRCNAVVESTEHAGFFWSQDITWANMTADDFIIGLVSAGTYNGGLGVESKAGKATLFFVTKPATSVYVNIYREVTTNV